MAIRLVDDESDVSVNLDLDYAYLEALSIQLQRAEAPEGSSFPKRFGTLFQEILGQTLDGDIKPPSQAQLRFALDIARELGVAIPGEALRYRGSMTSFIRRFEQQFREQRRRHRT